MKGFGAEGCTAVTYIKSCGILGLWAIILSILLFLFGIFLVTVVRTKKAAVIFLICAFIPLGLGLIGTAVGHANVNRVQHEFTITHHGSIKWILGRGVLRHGVVCILVLHAVYLWYCLA